MNRTRDAGLLARTPGRLLEAVLAGSEIRLHADLDFAASGTRTSWGAILLVVLIALLVWRATSSSKRQRSRARRSGKPAVRGRRRPVAARSAGRVSENHLGDEAPTRSAQTIAASGQTGETMQWP
jgi:hypothetical protein